MGRVVATMSKGDSKNKGIQKNLSINNGNI